MTDAILHELSKILAAAWLDARYPLPWSDSFKVGQLGGKVFDGHIRVTVEWFPPEPKADAFLTSANITHISGGGETISADWNVKADGER
jgi:hypothetical protein